MKRLITDILYPEDDHHSKTLLKMDRNKLFKGHNGFVTRNDSKNEKNITISNSYYNNRCVQIYNVITNETTIELHIHWDTNKKYKTLMKQFFPNNNYFMIHAVNDMYLFNFYYDVIHFTFMYTCPSIKFINHYDSLTLLKAFNYTVKNVKQKILNMSNEDFLDIYVFDELNNLNGSLNINYLL